MDSYRFGGYNLPMLTLDETGPAYVVASPRNYVVEEIFESWTVLAVWYASAVPSDRSPSVGTCPCLL